MEWISVKDRLPESGMYSVLSKNKIPVTANYDKKYGIWCLYIPGVSMLFQPVVEGVTHWMALAVPPEE